MKPMLECRCSVLYQRKKSWQCAGASSIEPKRAGKSGRYFKVLNCTSQEAAELAEQLIADTINKQNIVPGTLTLHVDHGTKTHSRPHCHSMAGSSRPLADRDEEAQQG